MLKLGFCYKNQLKFYLPLMLLLCGNIHSDGKEKSLFMCLFLGLLLVCGIDLEYISFIVSNS